MEGGGKSQESAGSISEKAMDFVFVISTASIEGVKFGTHDIDKRILRYGLDSERSQIFELLSSLGVVENTKKENG